MIQFDKVFEVFRNVIIYRLKPIIGRHIKVIQVRTTGAKPKEVFATMDIMFIDDKNSYLTNSWYDSVNQEMVYETHKSVRLQLGVRNGNPDNLQGQMDVYTLCNLLHKAFTEEAILGYIHDHLGATVTSVLAVRTLSDFLPTGVGNIQVFDMLIGMNDVTRTTNTPIENVEIGGSVGGEDVDIDVTSPPSACVGLLLEETSVEGLVMDRPSLMSYTFSGTGEGTYVVSNPTVQFTNTAFKYVWNNIDTEVVSKLTLDTNVYTITHCADRIAVKDSSGNEFDKPPSLSGEIVFIVNSKLPSTLDYITDVNKQINSIKINMPEHTTGSVGLVLYYNDFDGVTLPAGTRDICGNPIE